ncbi:MAG: hypothetical protein KUG77_00985 [Nannocystaceae bacterium]|nr:hypothetical protein [Nannocystaceae bacterium]
MATSAHSRVADRLLVRRLQQRLGALVVASALLGTSVPSVAFAAPSQEEIGRMYGEGQEYMEQKEFKRAADVFSRLLNLIEESADNKAIRESLILNILDAHMQAYDGIVDASGKRDIEQLEQGKSTLQQYYKDFQAVHGDSVAVIAEIQTTATKLDQKLKEAKEVVPDPDEEIIDGPPPPAAPAEPVIIRQGGSTEGLGLIIGGVGLGVVAIGTGVMIPLGSVFGQNAERDLSAAQTAEQEAIDAGESTSEAEADKQEANDAGARANALLITGAVLTPLLLGGAAALIVIGVKKRRSANSQAALRPAETLTAAPSFGRNYSGFSLSGRF